MSSTNKLSTMMTHFDRAARIGQGVTTTLTILYKGPIFPEVINILKLYF